MLFSSVTFLYWFLPVTLLVYFLTPMPGGSPRTRNRVLLVASLVFYAWGEPKYVALMAAQCVSAWGFGLLINKYRNSGAAKVLTFISAALSFSALLFFKYANFLLGNLNAITGLSLPLSNLLMPIGISFYTFQITSYTFDLYYGVTAVQRNLLDFSAYVALFPQLIAGPIVRYADVARALERRQHSLARFSFGARRFVVGLAKKMLLANVFGELVALFKAGHDQSVLFVWVYMLAFSLQIYYDFSGYSDMAIGLGHILGFTFLENFNYPYIAQSITDFWRRWHISLGSWFRDYLYIPMGGNRVSKGRHVLNLLIVWAVTGFWHGADWNFILWGAYFGAVLLLEKYLLSQTLARSPRLLRHMYVVLLLFISWALFDATEGLGHAAELVGRMFGAGGTVLAGRDALYYLRSYALILAIGIVGCTPLPRQLAKRLERRSAATVLEPALVLALLISSTACMVDGSFNPFIYFRF